MKESQNAEFKQSWHDEYLKWICGFANAKGGKLLIDVFDRLDYMEREGSGFKKIVGAYAPDVSHNPLGLAPKFYSAVGCFVVTPPNLN